MKNQNDFIFNLIFGAYKQQIGFNEKVNLDIYHNYLHFRQTQWKKCNTTYNRIKADNTNQRKKLATGRAHLKLFYRTIQFAIYHEVLLYNFKDETKLEKPQKIANLPRIITYKNLIELCSRLSNKMQININPMGLMRLVEIYLETKKADTENRSAKKLLTLDLAIWNKTIAKNQELSLDKRMFLVQRISLKTLYLSIQYLCEHILKPLITELKNEINLSTESIKLNSRHYCRDKFAQTYQINTLRVLFAYILDELAKEDELLAA